MKKLFFTSIVLLLAMVTQAQVKVAPKLTKGFTATYVDESTLNAAGNEMKAVMETTYTVTDVTADGAVIEVVQKVVTGIDGDDPSSKLLNVVQSVLAGETIKVATDSEGKILKIINKDELNEKIKAKADKAISEVLESSPELAQLPKEAIVEQISARLNDEALLETFDVLTLNGKTIVSGAQEEYTKEGMKMKRMYFVTGKSIIANASLNMSKDDLKQFIIAEVEKEAPDQAEMIKQNIDMVLSSMKFDMTEKTTYELQDNGWVKSIKTESKQEMMGQKSVTTSVITLK